MSNAIEKAITQIDLVNSKDPNAEYLQDQSYPKELLYSIRMSEKLSEFEPNASQELTIAARAQHIGRWNIPRDSYPMDRIGYLKWREELKKYHSKAASEILQECGFEEEFIKRVSFLIEKKALKKDAETQTLEDVICLVFLEYYFEEFVDKHNDREKIIKIIEKTWGKMSPKGRDFALKINFKKENLNLIKEALGL